VFVSSTFWLEGAVSRMLEELQSDLDCRARWLLEHGDDVCSRQQLRWLFADPIDDFATPYCPETDSATSQAAWR